MTWSFENAIDRLAKDSDTIVTLHRSIISVNNLAIFGLSVKSTDLRVQVPVWFLEVWYHNKETLRVNAFTQRKLYLVLRKKIRAMSLEERASAGVKAPKKAAKQQPKRKVPSK